ncbi:hypothetical protein L1049_019679 [Liquidambar formosana]|uniref:Ubiquitin-like protease family profile domain-containing protein n=1 Tax=Liquidambar formosana TaxID=63359 RepID=A0AAP0XAB9_LIQFO
MVAPHKNRKGRGVTYLPRLIKSRSAGIKPVVEYNSKGVPRGKVAKTLSSYHGTLARTNVPIIYTNWYVVPTELKNKLWSYVEDTFVVDPKSKKNTLSSIGLKWKTFKNRLTTKYIIPNLDNLENLRAPPELYKDCIEKGHWELFVRSRMTPEFMEIRSTQIERRKLNRYDHRLSRKGYVGLEDEIVKGTDRSVLWKLARQNKDGYYDDEGVKDRAKKIDELTQQVNDGCIEVEGTNDILTMALDTPEHSGAIRGVSKGVTQTAYFYTVDQHEEKAKKNLSKGKEQGKGTPDSTPLLERVSSNCSKTDVCHRYLYQILKNENLEYKYGFVNPATISSAGSMNPTTSRSKVLADRLAAERNIELFFVPYNPRFHWILIVIDPVSMIAYYMDPLGNDILPDIQNVIEVMFIDKTKKTIRKKCNWRSIKCPKQPGNVECGYYVMRYMKELIEDQRLSITEKFIGKDTYSKKEIDDVRIEWANAIQEYIC